MRRAWVSACGLAVLFVCWNAWMVAQEDHHSHQLSQAEVGSVQFFTSCDKSVEGSFNLAVALLHSFQYEQARQAFEAVFRQDARCAMAQWGIAMSHYHGLWDNGNLTAGRAAWRKAQEIAVSNRQTTAREAAYIGALGEIYAEDARTSSQRAQAFEQKMAAVQAGNRADDEAAIFHALTLAITAPKTDKTFSNQRRCGEILEPLFARLPNHPGIAHYLVHCYDNPVLAELGLPAARTYARIAPASAHANHMPSHIFTRVGAWNESITSNLRSAELAAAAETGSTNGEARDQRLHALDYLEYAYLQSGHIQKARALLAEINSLPPVAGLTLTGDYALAAVPARYSVELGDWDSASRLKVREQGVPWAQAITWLAAGIGSARAGNLQQASEAEKSLASLRDAIAQKNNTYWSSQVEVQRREVAAWIALRQSGSAEAVATMRSAAELEESMDKHAVTPGAVTPAREMLAQILAAQNRPKEALAEYEAVLKVAPNRFNALYGAACAAEASGMSDSAGRYYQKLTEVASGEERPELATARKKAAKLSSAVRDRQ